MIFFFTSFYYRWVSQTFCIRINVEQKFSFQLAAPLHHHLLKEKIKSNNQKHNQNNFLLSFYFKFVFGIFFPLFITLNTGTSLKQMNHPAIFLSSVLFCFELSTMITTGLKLLIGRLISANRPAYHNIPPLYVFCCCNSVLEK